jgi:Asp/Glu/hydantoin racemase
VHTLVPELGRRFPGVAVTGIFEASILTALSLLPDPQERKTWGIVTTGKFWEKHLSDGANAFLGQPGSDANSRFAGVFSTGLDAGDFHHVSPEQVREKLKAATRSLLQSGDVGCVVMGCAGMAGLESIIRETVREEYGSEKRVSVVDGVKAGTLQLEQMVRSRRAFAG